MSFLIVDKMFDVHPIILKDSYWGEVPSELKDVAPPDVNFFFKYLGSNDFNVLLHFRLHQNQILQTI